MNNDDENNNNNNNNNSSVNRELEEYYEKNQLNESFKTVDNNRDSRNKGIVAKSIYKLQKAVRE